MYHAHREVLALRSQTVIQGNPRQTEIIVNECVNQEWNANVPDTRESATPPEARPEKTRTKIFITFNSLGPRARRGGRLVCSFCFDFFEPPLRMTGSVWHVLTPPLPRAWRKQCPNARYDREESHGRGTPLTLENF